MTETEFRNLDFGSIFFNKDGLQGVVITKFYNDDISVCYHTDIGLDRVQIIKVRDADTIFLEKPKKQVQKEVLAIAVANNSGGIDIYNYSSPDLVRELLETGEKKIITMTYSSEE